MSDTTKAVFLSYASQDAEAARRICEALRASGVEVWFDQNELVGGDAWDQKIRRQIKECALFVPIISANTQARREGYFRLEWRLADQRTHLMAKGLPFLLPVVIDETRDSDAHVPDSFTEVQWTRLPGGETNAAFGERVTALLDGSRSRLDAPATVREPTRAAAPSTSPPRRRWLWPAGVALLLAVIFVAVVRWRGSPPTPGVETIGARASQSEVAALLTRVRALTEKTDVVRIELDTATGLLEQAGKLDATDATVWAERALLDRRYVDEWYDRSPSRLDAMQRHATQAFGLDPANPKARLARASALVLLNKDAATKADAIKLLESVTGEPGANPGALVLLASLKYQSSQPEAAFGYLDRAAQFPGWNGRAAIERAWSYYRANDWDRGIGALDEALAVEPAAALLLLKGYIITVWRGDMATATRLIANVPPDLLVEDFPASARYFIELSNRNFEGAYEAFRVVPRDYVESTALSGPTGYYKGYALARAGKISAAKIEWQSALELVNRRLDTQPNNRTLLEFKAALLGSLGNKAEAQEIWRSVRELFGATVESWVDHITAMELLSEDAAIDQLASLGKKGSPIGLAANLRLSPFLDRLRTHPRFIALLAQAEADPRLSPRAKAAQALAPAVREAAPADKSIAVLAFRQLSADPENEYLCEAISDELCSVLGRVPRLKVAASASAFTFKGRRVPPAEMAAQLGVAYLVDGTVQKLGNRVRVRAQLIKAADGFAVWSSDALEHDAKDMFAVQDEVVAAIAKSLQLRLGAAVAAPAVINPEAYRLYAEGRRAWSMRGTEEFADKAEDYFRRAIAADPKLGRAYSGLADALAVAWTAEPGGLTFADRNSDRFRELQSLVDTALRLEPESAEAYASRGGNFWQAWRMVDAERDLRTAIRLNPNYADGHQRLGRLLSADGRIDEAVREIKRASELDPLSSRILDNYSGVLREAGRYTEALAQAERALALQPDSPQALRAKMAVLSQLGRHDEALAITRSPAFRGAKLYSIGILVRAGRKEEAAQLYSTLHLPRRRTIVPLAALGRYEEALNSLHPDEAAMTAVTGLFYYDTVDPIRNDPRFISYLTTLGIKEAHDRAQAWRAAHPPEKPQARK
jgi:TolB-like protein/Tfp pilus assembly protein PilF